MPVVIVHARVTGSVTSESQTRPQKAVKEVAWAIVMKRDGTPGPRAEKGPRNKLQFGNPGP